MKLPLFQVDAFTSRRFSGNPAAVCPLEKWLPDELMQSIALENNLSETAFFVREGDGFRIRWFTPTTEVDLCGHATLATAFVLFNELEKGSREVTFQSKSGPLRVTTDGARITLFFPRREPKEQKLPEAVKRALGGNPLELHVAKDWMVLYGSAEEVRRLKPDMRLTAQLEARGVIVTAKGDDCDFVSRFFVPGQGIDEDPVTGSAHCTLVPFWSQRLGKKTLHAKQVSARGGELFCVDAGPIVEMSGHGALYLRGEIDV
ncbi:MAG: PhzF family phenazine biosynthesis protein [Myxococcaceae bacterium]